MTPGPDPALETRIFNDDLLLNVRDLKYAQDQFPKIFPLLDNSALRSVFRKYEKRANEAHLWVHGLGLFAVVFGTIALVSAATSSFHAPAKYSRSLTIVFEACGVLAALVAGGSLWLGPWKRRWLESRFMTERLRQWHFQLFIRRAGDIETGFANMTPGSLHTFQARRQQWLDNFLRDHEGKLDSRMDSFTHDPDVSNDWLHDSPSRFDANCSILPQLFEAYLQLRFLHQYDYLIHKFSRAEDRPFWQLLSLPLLRQDSLIGGAVSFCFVTTLLGALAVIVNPLFQVPPPFYSFLQSSTLMIAIIGIALKTIHDGLGVTRDIERYRDYLGKVRRALLQFQATQDPRTKLHLMEELELAAVDELRGFLRTHGDSRFVM